MRRYKWLRATAKGRFTFWLAVIQICNSAVPCVYEGDFRRLSGSLRQQAWYRQGQRRCWLGYQRGCTRRPLACALTNGQSCINSLPDYFADLHQPGPSVAWLANCHGLTTQARNTVIPLQGRQPG